MRLDKITIGSAKESPTHQFKNLKDVTIDFDEQQWITVVIGWNGTGKSNVLEALATIFRDLIMQKRISEFAFVLDYRMGKGDNIRYIHIDADPDRKQPYTIHIQNSTDKNAPIKSKDLFGTTNIDDNSKVSLKSFFDNDNLNLPKYVFGYYSGESTRMHDVFRPYLKKYDSDLRGAKDPGLKRLFFALPEHSQYVLLAFLMNQNDEERMFLDKHLGLDVNEGIESVLFVLRQPPWNGHPDGDPRVWRARGIVSNFLGRLHEVALAPARIKRRVPVSLWNDKRLEFLYLYVKDVSALRSIVGSQSPAEFFRDLESTYVSELIEQVRIRIKLKKNDSSVTFSELSEGERQLFTVLGLLRFTAEEESLFLLDEPDTHLNPRWSVDFLDYIKAFVGSNEQSEETRHVVLTTHNPLAIAELNRFQVQILHRDRESNHIKAEYPEVDPKGMGYAGIITSDMFGLGSSLDKSTNKDLIELHKLSIRESLTEDDLDRLEQIRKSLEGLDFNFASRDRLEQEYLRARFDLTTDESFKSPIITNQTKEDALEALIKSLLGDLEND